MAAPCSYLVTVLSLHLRVLIKLIKVVATYSFKTLRALTLSVQVSVPQRQTLAAMAKICRLLRLTKKKAAIHFQFRNELPLLDNFYYRINYLYQFFTFQNNNYFF
jgi:hypothetical protein